MKTITDYRTEILIILGDTAGKRYSEAQLDAALRQALGRLNKSRPAREIYKVKVADREIRDVIINWCPGPGADILSVRNEAGEWLSAADYRTGGKTYLTIYEGGAPEIGDQLQLEVTGAHTISGLDNAGSTSIPDSLMETVCTGAAGYAMRIRARSVTEVFGKRPEDTDKLILQADFLLADFEADLELRSLSAVMHSDPWPHRGFLI